MSAEREREKGGWLLKAIPQEEQNLMSRNEREERHVEYSRVEAA
jgi:hypothetical protein